MGQDSYFCQFGFSKESSENVLSMLEKGLDWEDQFETGRMPKKLPRENKTTIAPTFPGLDIDNRPGRQPGSQGKHEKHSSLSIYPVALGKGNPQQGPRSRSDLTGLRMFEEASAKAEECRQPPAKRSPEQNQATQQAQQAAAAQGQTFDQMNQQKHQQLSQQGGETPRKKELPICPSPKPQS